MNVFDYAILIGALFLEIMAFMYAVEVYINKMLKGRDNGNGSLRV
jgi:hypothetical protein